MQKRRAVPIVPFNGWYLYYRRHVDDIRHVCNLCESDAALSTAFYNHLSPNHLQFLETAIALRSTSSLWQHNIPLQPIAQWLKALSGYIWKQFRKSRSFNKWPSFQLATYSWLYCNVLFLPAVMKLTDTLSGQFASHICLAPLPKEAQCIAWKWNCCVKCQFLLAATSMRLCKQCPQYSSVTTCERFSKPTLCVALIKQVISGHTLEWIKARYVKTQACCISMQFTCKSQTIAA